MNYMSFVIAINTKNTSIEIHLYLTLITGSLLLSKIQPLLSFQKNHQANNLNIELISAAISFLNQK